MVVLRVRFRGTAQVGQESLEARKCLKRQALQKVCRHSVMVVAFLKRPLQRVQHRCGFRVDTEKVARPFLMTGSGGGPFDVVSDVVSVESFVVSFDVSFDGLTGLFDGAFDGSAVVAVVVAVVAAVVVAGAAEAAAEAAGVSDGLGLFDGVFDASGCDCVCDCVISLLFDSFDVLVVVLGVDILTPSSCIFVYR
jgi:hypothetical protein